MTPISEQKDDILLIKEIAKRMREPDDVKRIVLGNDNHHSEVYPLNPYWSDFSIAGGYPGVLILLAELDRKFPQENWDEAGHAYVLKIKEGLENNGLDSRFISIFSGLTGICFALKQASRNGKRYQKMIDTLNTHILKMVETLYLFPLKENLKAGRPSPASLYDLIQGIVGVGVYGLDNLNSAPFLHFVEKTLTLLVGLTKPIKIEKKWVPGWYTPSEYLFLDKNRRSFPKGNFNLGLSHGVSCVLAFLAVASIHNVIVEGQMEAIESINLWFQKHRRQNEDMFFWETVISFENESKEIKQSSFSGRDAWCYGSPGVARSLFLAGKALKNESIKTFATESFCSIFKRSRETWNLPSPTFCHGISGLLLITSLMARDTQNSDLKRQTLLLKQVLLDYYSPDYPFGFKDLESCQEGGYAKINKAGLLDGASGALLTLLSLEESSWWHAPFLIDAGKTDGK